MGALRREVRWPSAGSTLATARGSAGRRDHPLALLKHARYVATVLPKLAEGQCSSHRCCQTSSSTAAVCSCFETASQLRSDFSGRWAKTRRRASPGSSEMGSAITVLAQSRDKDKASPRTQGMPNFRPQFNLPKPSNQNASPTATPGAYLSFRWTNISPTMTGSPSVTVLMRRAPLPPPSR